MPSAEEIQQYLTGAWRMMIGKADGLKLLDLSADGFWNSFLAIPIALPALIVGWVGIANELGENPADFGGRLSILIRLAIVDFSAWVVPLAAFAAVVSRVGLRDRFVHYVVASNWSSALIVWLMLPPALLRLVVPATADFAGVLSLALFAVSMVMTWRLTNVAIGKNASIATAVFAAMFFVSLVVLLGLQAALGLNGPDQLAG